MTSPEPHSAAIPAGVLLVLLPAADRKRPAAAPAGPSRLEALAAAVAGPVRDNGGRMLAPVGDAVLARFDRPGPAVTAAVGIVAADGAVRQAVRIGIAPGLPPDADRKRFADAVICAVQLAAQAAGRQILVAAPLLGAMTELAGIRFAPLPRSPGDGAARGDPGPCQVVWEPAVQVEPPAAPLVVIKPLWRAAPPGFAAIWSELAQKVKSRSGVRHCKSFGDRSLALVTRDLEGALHIGRYVLAGVQRAMDVDGRFHLLPIQVVIDSGPFLEGDTIQAGRLGVDWPVIAPGRIHVARAVCGPMDDLPAGAAASADDRFVMLGSAEPRVVDMPPLFHYQEALVRGPRPPCFYCGARRHDPGDCPSKNAADPPAGLKALGYLDPAAFNRDFYRLLAGPAAGPAREADSAGPEAAFLDLNYFCQLRFLRRLWSDDAPQWAAVLARRREQPKGGPLWLAQDCLRTGRLAQAMQILEREGDGADYRTHCLWGLIHVEQAAPAKAALAFHNALDVAETAPVKILALFLLLRLYRMVGDAIRAEQTLARIRAIDKTCIQAEYEAIKLQLEDGLSARALNRLGRLIEKDRDYFVAALIDPELAASAHLVQPRLAACLAAARKKATESRQAAEAVLEKVTAQLGAASCAALEPEAAFRSIDAQVGGGSFFGYLDATAAAERLAAAARRVLSTHRCAVYESLQRIDQGLADQMGRVARYPAPRRMTEVSQRLAVIQGDLEQLKGQLRTDAPPGTAGRPGAGRSMGAGSFPGQPGDRPDRQGRRPVAFRHGPDEEQFSSHGAQRPRGDVFAAAVDPLSGLCPAGPGDIPPGPVDLPKARHGLWQPGGLAAGPDANPAPSRPVSTSGLILFPKMCTNSLWINKFQTRQGAAEFENPASAGPGGMSIFEEVYPPLEGRNPARAGLGGLRRRLSTGC